MTSRILITGGGGFIGANVARRLLADGHAVDIADNFSRGVRDDELAALAARPDVRVFDRDLSQADAWNDLPGDYEAVYHLAAIVGVANVLGAPYRVLDLNVAMTAHALGLAARQTALERFVFASTSEVYAGTLQTYGLTFPTPESTPLSVPDLAHPRTSYMLSKIYGEALCHQAGVPFTIVRPHNVYGPRMGMSHVIPELMQRAWTTPEGGVLSVSSVDHRRTFCFIDDAVEMIVRAARAPEGRGATLNIGTMAPEVAMGDLALQVAEVVGRRLTVEPLPPTPGSPVRRAPDTARIAAVTGYAAAVSLREGLTRTFAWYRENVFTAG